MEHGSYHTYYLLQKYITIDEFIEKPTNYCSIMDQYLVWYPLASMMAATLCGQGGIHMWVLK